jgi:hypothetical protein
MPRLDSCHTQVVNAFRKDGWTTTENVRIGLKNERRYIDIFARRRTSINLEELLLLEVKCFPNRDVIATEMQHAVGQYLYYDLLLKLNGGDIPLYLTIPNSVFLTMKPMVHHFLEYYRIKSVVVDLDHEEIVQWNGY